MICDFGGGGIDRSAGQHQLGDFLRKARGVGRRKPPALAEPDQGCAPAEVVDRHVQIAKIGVDAVAAHVAGSRLPRSQSDKTRSAFDKGARKAVAFGEIGDRRVMDRVRRNDQHGPVRRARRVATLQKQHGRKFDAHALEGREGGQVDQVRPMAAARRGDGESLDDALQPPRNGGRPSQAPQFERVVHNCRPRVVPARRSLSKRRPSVDSLDTRRSVVGAATAKLGASAPPRRRQFRRRSSSVRAATKSGESDREAVFSAASKRGRSEPDESDHQHRPGRRLWRASGHIVELERVG